MNSKDTKRLNTVVIGGGQAGLSVGYHLARREINFKILDANKRVGDSWRNRWDSLRLFTPARYSGLDGWPFPARGDAFPTKNQMADYLEAYAVKFRLPILTEARVEKLSKQGDQFVVMASGQRFEAENVVVAMGNYQTPRLPKFAGELSPEIRQIHSYDYRNPSQLQPGGVLVVGVGNSGADIAMEVARNHETWISGKESGHIPWPIESFMGRNFLIRLVRFVGHHVLTVSTPMGRKLRPKMLGQPAPLIRVKPKDLVNAGITRVSKVIGALNGKPLLADERTLDVSNVIWCTGFDAGFSWIQLPVFGDDGRPIHERGIVERVPGFYFVGLRFLYSMTSDAVTGVGRDAERIARALEKKRLARVA